MGRQAHHAEVEPPARRSEPLVRLLLRPALPTLVPQVVVRDEVARRRPDAARYLVNSGTR